VSLRPVVIEQFPGLDLRQDPGDATGAIDLANVTLESGRVRTRDGTSLFATPFASTNGVAFLSQFAGAGGAVPQLISLALIGANNLAAISAAGATIATTTVAAPAAQGASGVAIGTPAAAFYYVAAGLQWFQWSGAAWTGPLAAPANPVVLSVSPSDNRLILIGGNGLTTAYFSDPGAPTTFGANNYVVLTPGDGEYIMGAAVFNNQTFVFKQSKFFVFYGTSTDSTGNPIFNYRTIDTGIGVTANSQPVPQSVCSSEFGVFFVGARGIYVTTGAAPVLISQKIQPFFDATTGPYWQGGNWNPVTATARLAWSNGRLYFSTGSGVFVWNRALDAWSWWNLSVGSVGAMAQQNNVGAPATVMFGAISGTPGNTIVKVAVGVTTDNGTAIVSRYRLPFETYGNPGEKRIREVVVEGTGTPTIGVTADWSSTGISKALTLGTSPAINDDRMHNAWRGRAFSLQLSAASGAWAVNRMQANVADAVRPVSVTV
jgi:hypothetical protein